MIFLAKGTCTMGLGKRDKDGNIVEYTPAKFTASEDGNSIVIGKLNPETMKPAEPVDFVYGDWDAASYLGKALELLNPRRRINIPDFKAIIQTAYKEDGNDLICDYCPRAGYDCRDCIVKEWKAEVE